MPEKLPTSWLRLTLGDLGRFNTSSVDKLVQPHEDPVSLVNYMDVYRHLQINSGVDLQMVTATKEERARYQVQEGDILFTPSSETPDDIGHSAVVAEELCETLHSYHTVRLRPDGRVPLDICFGGYFANSGEVRRYFARRAAGSTRYTLSLDSFRSARVVLPPIGQQRRIAEILSTVDEAIGQTEALIAKTQQIKAGLMHDLFTRGVTVDGQLRPPREEAPQLYKESPLGWIPKEWDVAPCGEVFDVQLGKMMSPAASAGPNQKPYLRNQNVYWDRLELCDVATMHFSIDDMHKYRLQHGDLLACEGRFIGRCAVWRGELDECYYQKALHRLRALGSKVTTDYMQFFMSLRFELDRGFVEKMTHESTIPHLPLEKLVALPVLIPPRDEQDCLVRTLGGLTHRDRIDRAHLGKAKQLKAALMGDLLTGRVTVEKGFVLGSVGVAANV